LENNRKIPRKYNFIICPLKIIKKSSQKEDFLGILGYDISMYKIFLLIASILFVIGIGSYFLFFQTKPIWTIETSTTDAVPTVISYEQERINVTQKNTKNSELYNTAMQEQDISLCVGISDEGKKTECHDMIVATTAKKWGTIETCDTLTNTGVIVLCRDAISTDRAIATIDKTICNHISDEDRRMSCKENIDEIQFANKTRDKAITREFCDTLGDKYQSICLTQVREIDETAVYRDALAKNDARICEQIIQTELRNTCLDTIRLKSAVTSENTTLCETISDANKKLYCEAQVSKTADIAIYKTAITGTDTASCQKITNTNLQSKCNDTIIIATVKRDHNTALCYQLTNTGSINACKQIWQ
jgi:hypothetical protein